MLLPKEITLFNQKIKIIKSRTLLSRTGMFGECDFNKHKIYIQQSTRKHKITEEQLSLTLDHEVLHMILYLSGYDKLMYDEIFINTVSGLLNQYINQRK
jgi:hypothetical protein